MNNKIFYVLIGSVVILAGALAYSVYLLASSDPPETEATPDDARLNLTSLIAYAPPNHEFIGEIKPGMEFQLGKPVLLQTNFTNPDLTNEEFVIIVDVRNNTNTEAYSFLQSSFNSDRISKEVLWSPQHIGDYRMMVFLLKASELNSTKLMTPIASVPLIVVE